MPVEILVFLLANPLLIQDPPILVDRRGFECLARNIDRAPKNRRLVYVDIRTCPPRFMQASYPRPPSPPDPNRMEWVLSLDRVEIACIRRHRADLGPIARLEGSDKYRVSFAACRAKA